MDANLQIKKVKKVEDLSNHLVLIEIGLSKT
jgi:hypothetical protein